MIRTERNQQVSEYLKEACAFIKRMGPEKIKNFVQLYLAAYFNEFHALDSWPKTIAQFDLEQFKEETIYRINKDIYFSIDVEDQSNIEIIHWLVNNPPIHTNEDILGSIYLLCSTDSHRKSMGEHYTRTDLVEHMVYQLLELREDKQIKIHELRFIDPACGSGNFLIEILRRGIKDFKGSSEEFLDKLSKGKFIVGIDIQEIACLISKVRIIMELIKSGIEYERDLFIPIYNFNSLLTENDVVKENSFDVVITNPPFLRYQSIDQQSRKTIAKKYMSCTGRYDLYTIFIEKSIILAKENGYVAIICSDMFMTAAYGKGIRGFARENATLLFVLDLREIYPFDASVLSSVFFFRKTVKMHTPILSIVRIEDDTSFKVETIGVVDITDNWRYADSNSEEAFAKIRENVEAKKLGDVANIFVGIKTTADGVYCKPVTNDFVRDKRLEESLIHPLLRGLNLKRWSINWTGNQPSMDTNIIYPYRKTEEGTVPIQISDYPNTEKYLTLHMAVLEAREYFKESSKQWYELWVPVSFEVFEQTKIITPDIASRCSFVLDTEGFFCNGTIYGIILKNEKVIENYRYLIGILNSKVIEFFHKKYNPNKIHSHKFRFQTGTMKNYPIVIKPSSSKEFHELVHLVEKIGECKDIGNLDLLEKEMNRIVYHIYGLTLSEVDTVERYINQISN
ncbi:Modification methylase PaeR7I [compost metagenome]